MGTATSSSPSAVKYALPMDRGARGMESAQLFPALEEEQVNMLASNATDGHLVSPQFTVLADDRGVFTPYQAALLVRQDALTDVPDLRTALSDLSGKLSTEKVRRLREHWRFDSALLNMKLSAISLQLSAR